MTPSSLGCEFPIFYGQCLRRVRYLTLNDVLIILEELRRAYPKDLIRVMNRGAIESALEAVRYARRGLRSFRARVAAKAASLLYFIVMSHPLTDGNKRFGHMVLWEFLRINGYGVSPAIIRDLTLGIASMRLRVEDVYYILYREMFRVGD